MSRAQLYFMRAALLLVLAPCLVFTFIAELLREGRLAVRYAWNAAAQDFDAFREIWKTGKPRVGL